VVAREVSLRVLTLQTAVSGKEKLQFFRFGVALGGRRARATGCIDFIRAALKFRQMSGMETWYTYFIGFLIIKLISC